MGVISELKSLDDFTGEARKKAGKGKGKERKPRPTGPDLPRTRISTEKVAGEVAEWKGKYGWVKPSQTVDHPMAGKHKGKLYIHAQDLVWADELSVGQVCHFYIFSDASGLGAEECVADGEWDPDDGEAWDEEWDDASWEAWKKEQVGKEGSAARGVGSDCAMDTSDSDQKKK